MGWGSFFFFFFIRTYSYSSTTFGDNYTFSIKLPLTFVKNQLNLSLDCFILLIYMSVSLLISHCLDYYSFIDYAKAFDCVDHNKLWNILKEMVISDHLTCLLRNLYAGQEATVRTGHGTTDWFKIGKGVHQGCMLSPCLFNLYVEHIMWNASPDEAQAEIKTARRNINKLNRQMTPPLWQKAKRNWRASWWKWKRRVKKLA